MSHDTQSSDERITTDRDTIRTWIEARGGVPAVAPGSEETHRFVRRDRTNGTEAEEWDTFFETFENEELAFVYSENGDDGNLEGYELISREEAADRIGGDRDAVEDALQRGETVSPDAGSDASTETSGDTGTVGAGETATTPEEPHTEDIDTGAESGIESDGVEQPTEAGRTEIEVSVDDRGKTVFNQADEKVGTVVDVDGDAIYVAPNPKLLDRIKIGLGLGGEASDDGTYTVDRSHIRTVSTDRIVID